MYPVGATLRPLRDTSGLSGTIPVSMNMIFIDSVIHFVLQISQPREIAQKWFCIQYVRMDLSFQGNKRFENPIIGRRDIKQKPSLILFGTPCIIILRLLSLVLNGFIQAGKLIYSK